MNEPPNVYRPCTHADEVARLQQRLADTEQALAELREDVARIRAAVVTPDSATSPAPRAEASKADQPLLLNPSSLKSATSQARFHVDHRSSPEDKVALFRDLFSARDDVYARRWENRAKGTDGWAPAHAGDWQTPRDKREYLPLTDAVLTSHLEGRQAVGLYPLCRDDSCRLLAVDFDGSTWRLDAQAYVEASQTMGMPAAVELSRSGNGAHVWMFFAAPVAATQARAMGAALLREAMALRGELDLDSYDRFFPSQDHLPERGFGNLIALPLHGGCRREHGTTVFLDPRTFEPFEDQFAFLSTIPRIAPSRVSEVVDELQPVTVGPDTTLHVSTVRADPPPPATIASRLAGMLAIRRAGIPSGLYATLKHLATLHNPKFHKNEALRLSNHETPRFIRCYAEDLEHLYLPRGLVDKAASIIADAGSHLDVVDERTDPAPLKLTFKGELRDEQTAAVEKLVEHDLAVLDAPPGAGKTVIGCAVIAHHRVPTLVLVDRKPLLAQWQQRLRTHLDIDAGQIGGGKKRPTKTVDIAMVQTMTRSAAARELLDGYGLIIVDECHHVPAPTVERAIRTLDARRWLGLTATPQRSDGLREIMVMQCGPIRCRIQPNLDDLPRTLQTHRTDLRITTSTEGLTRGELNVMVNDTVAEDERRTNQVCQDVAEAMSRGRHCLVLTSRTEHVLRITETLRGHGLEPLTLYGSLKPKQREAVHRQLADEGRQLLLVATDRYIGEGFDCPRLDTLFLAFPISAPQRITQYVGRILRKHPDKTTAEVHDYLDAKVPVLAAMHRRRRPGYRQLGFSPENEPGSAPSPGPEASSPEATSTRRHEPAARAEPAAARIRDWARNAGYAVSNRGRISTEIRQAYHDAHP